MNKQDLIEFQKATEVFLNEQAVFHQKCSDLQDLIKSKTKVKIIQEHLGISKQNMTNKFNDPSRFTLEEVQSIFTFLNL
jgi:hypothetical protein